MQGTLDHARTRHGPSWQCLEAKRMQDQDRLSSRTGYMRPGVVTMASPYSWYAHLRVEAGNTPYPSVGARYVLNCKFRLEMDESLLGMDIEGKRNSRGNPLGIYNRRAGFTPFLDLAISILVSILLSMSTRRLICVRSVWIKLIIPIPRRNQSLLDGFPCNPMKHARDDTKNGWRRLQQEHLHSHLQREDYHERPNLDLCIAT